MEKTLKIGKSSDLYTKIDALDLSSADRTEALGALAAAERLVQAADAIARLLGAASSSLKPGPVLKHQ